MSEILEKTQGIIELGEFAYWYSLHKEACPNCGLNLSKQSPASNMYPHWMGACKK